MKSVKIKRSALAAPIGALMLALAGCGGKPPPPAPPPPEVEIMTVRTQPVPNVIVLPGRVHSVRSAEVRARVDGIVERRLYDEGTDVRAGQALFAIDPRQLRASLNAVLASLSRAQANAANAQQDVNRYRPLLVDQAISKQEYDAAVARLRTAQADVAQARAQVESARLSLGYTIVIAPISGRAGRAEVTEGALVSASAGTLMTNIEQLDPIYVDFGQSSANLLEVRREIAAGKLNLPSLNTIEVQLELEDGTRYGPMGRIDFLDLSIGEETGTAAVRAQFPNPGRLLLPGQFVRARILAGTREGGIVLPQRAIRVTKDGGTAMVVGEGNRVEVRRVKLGDLRGGLWVVSEGLRPGERVIVNGLQKAQPGQPVRIAPPRPVRSPPPSAK